MHQVGLVALGIFALGLIGLFTYLVEETAMEFAAAAKHSWVESQTRETLGII